MVDPAEIQAYALGAIFREGFPVGVEEEMIVAGEMIEEARAEAEHLFLAIGGSGTVDAGIGDLFEVIAVQAETQSFGDDFAGC